MLCGNIKLKKYCYILNAIAFFWGCQLYAHIPYGLLLQSTHHEVTIVSAFLQYLLISPELNIATIAFTVITLVSIPTSTHTQQSAMILYLPKSAQFYSGLLRYDAIHGVSTLEQVFHILASPYIQVICPFSTVLLVMSNVQHIVGYVHTITVTTSVQSRACYT